MNAEPRSEHAATVAELGRVRDEVAALPALADYIRRETVLALLRDRMDALTWGDAEVAS